MLRTSALLLAPVLFATLAFADDEKKPAAPAPLGGSSTLVRLDAGVERIVEPARDGDDVGLAASPELKADDDDPKVRETLAKLYAMSATQFEWRVEPGKTKGPFAERAVLFPSPLRRGVPSDVIHGVLFEPQNLADDARIPAAVILHHSGGSFEAEAIMARHLAQHGVASLTIELPNYGARKLKGTSTGFLDADSAEAVHLGFRQAILDARRAADFLRSRPHVDPSRVGIAGVSLGSIVAASAAGVDPRFARVFLVIGGGDLAKILTYSSEAARARAKLAEKNITPELLAAGMASVDPVTFAARMRADDVLMLNASKDEIIPRASTDALWRRAGYPEIRWFDCGHYGMVAHVLEIMQTMLDHMTTRAPARESW